jgi:membrane-bound metal-dependent hydrolase YbcI (DUF457 family)
LVAVACMTAYNIWIGPAIVEAVNGYRPSLEYQEVPPDALVAGLDVYRQSIDVLLDGVRVLLGSVSRVMAALLLGAVVAVGLVRSRRWPMATAALAILAVSHIVMFAVMIVRHPPLYEWLDHRFWYYPLPTQALLLALLVMLLNRAMADWARWRVMVLNLTLTAAVVSNVAHWTDYRDLMLTSRWFSRVYPQTQMLRDSLREGVPDPGLIRQYRQFYDFCLTLSPGLSERAAAAGTSPRP